MDPGRFRADARECPRPRRGGGRTACRLRRGARDPARSQGPRHDRSPKEAERRYQEVAKEHGDLTAGETALYASARMAQQRGDTVAAKKLLQTYLQRYPRGLFA